MVPKRINLKVPNTPSKSASFAVSLQRHQEAQEEYAYLSSITHFSEDTLRLMHTRFGVIDGSISLDARISLDEFAEIVSMPQSSLLVIRFFKYMDRHNLEGLTFRTFATTVSVLCAEGDVAAKKQLSFALYDLNDDGFVDSAELTALLKDCRAHLGPLAAGLDQQGIARVVRRTFDAIDTEHAQKMSFAEYSRFADLDSQRRCLAPFSMDIAKLIGYEAERRRLRRLDEAELERSKELHHGPLSLENPKGKGKARAFWPSMHFGVGRSSIERVQSIHCAKDIHCGSEDTI